MGQGGIVSDYAAGGGGPAQWQGPVPQWPPMARTEPAAGGADTTVPQGPEAPPPWQGPVNQPDTNPSYWNAIVPKTPAATLPGASTAFSPVPSPGQPTPPPLPGQARFPRAGDPNAIPSTPPPSPTRPPGSGLRDALGGLGKGLVAAAGDNRGKFASFIRGAGAGLEGTQEARDKREKFDELKRHTAFIEQQQNIGTYMKQAQLWEQMRLSQSRRDLLDRSSGKGATGGATRYDNPYWRQFSADKVVTDRYKDQNKNLLDAENIILRNEATGAMTKQQADAQRKIIADKRAAMQQEMEQFRQEQYKKYGVTPAQAQKNNTMGQTRDNPIDPHALGLSPREFDFKVQPGQWYIPKQGADPVPRTEPQRTQEYWNAREAEEAKTAALARQEALYGGSSYPRQDQEETD